MYYLPIGQANPYNCGYTPSPVCPITHTQAPRPNQHLLRYGETVSIQCKLLRWSTTPLRLPPTRTWESSGTGARFLWQVVNPWSTPHTLRRQKKKLCLVSSSTVRTPCGLVGYDFQLLAYYRKAPSGLNAWRDWHHCSCTSPNVQHAERATQRVNRCSLPRRREALIPPILVHTCMWVGRTRIHYRWIPFNP